MEELCMVDTFREKGKGEEHKYNLSQELQFKANSRRNKLLGLWLSEQHFGLQGAEAQEYANELVILDLDAPGIDNVVEKIMLDIGKRNCKLSEQLLREKIIEIQKIAEIEVKNEA